MTSSDHNSPEEITMLLRKWQAGDAVAGEDVIARTYEELRRMARARTAFWAEAGR